MLFRSISFALLGIKEIYNGLPIRTILYERMRDPVALFLIFVAMAILLFARRIDFTRITKES